ncbi:hypothetical protein [Pseudoalteromonas gelatinilytica]|uniref:Uncharacterized protein n=1 Tax=Pseudoalteromonas gelatinilytica TaxID=1703256 RepID=A0ABQ1TGA0_9GAMM|nr:hypothetical protein [Pseudoalteromonas profundi]GGE94833.1 hypothetical protein GCM10008027_19750 [Pseudoalteromonas profundi]
MRILIFLLALTSAFFAPTTFSVQLDLDDLRDPKVNVEHIYRCNFSFSWGGGTTSKVPANSISEAYSACAAWGLTNIDRSQPCGTSSKSSNGRDRIYIPLNSKMSDGSCNVGGQGGGQINISLTDEGTTETESCPPDTSPEHKYDYNIDGVLKCAKEKDFCPEPSDNDPFVFGTGGQTEKCFKNADGTQCKIQTDENGGYYMPVSYGSAEPVMCERAPDKEVDKTSEPEEKPAPEETDPQPEPDELSAINKINENLDAMNKNQIAASDSNDDRLDRVAEEIQISNELLGEIRYNTAMTDFNTDYANALLEGILEKPVGGGGGSGSGDGDGEEEQPFTIQAKRKNNNKGLNKLFTEQDLQTVTEEITQKRQELKDYVQQIKSESGSLFEVTPSFGGGYEERIVNIKGADVDMGLGRLASFFQLIAAAVLLISTLTALYILLGP